YEHTTPTLVSSVWKTLVQVLKCCLLVISKPSANGYCFESQKSCAVM
ncbi:DNA internalization-related competence protein ComEC/Rec2, partial [Vibrio parahaemolyticus V-223/04]